MFHDSGGIWGRSLAGKSLKYVIQRFETTEFLVPMVNSMNNIKALLPGNNEKCIRSVHVGMPINIYQQHPREDERLPITDSPLNQYLCSLKHCNIDQSSRGQQPFLLNNELQFPL